MAGQPADEIRAEPALVPHKVHPGGRPSSLVVFELLDARMLGRLVALYEHKVFAQSVLWGVNAFDQWGVELGKKLAERLAPAVRDPAAAAGGTSTVLRSLLGRIAKWRPTS
jgi:glucose-6-phosphate isomerase